MELYLVSPHLAANSDEAAEVARLKECNRLIADLICQHLSPDPALFGMCNTSKYSNPPVALDTRYGYVDTVRIADQSMLREILLACGDVNNGKWMLIRSLVTCRSVYFGFDGQAFVCLPTEADPMVSPDDALIIVEDCSPMLTEMSWMDGLFLH
jgi:hypothetical protein